MSYQDTFVDLFVLEHIHVEEAIIILLFYFNTYILTYIYITYAIVSAKSRAYQANLLVIIIRTASCEKDLRCFFIN